MESPNPQGMLHGLLRSHGESVERLPHRTSATPTGQTLKYRRRHPWLGSCFHGLEVTCWSSVLLISKWVTRVGWNLNSIFHIGYKRQIGNKSKEKTKRWENDLLHIRSFKHTSYCIASKQALNSFIKSSPVHSQILDCMK